MIHEIGEIWILSLIHHVMMFIDMNDELGRAKDIREGLGLAREVIRSGGAIAKLREWVSAQNTDPASGLKKLEGLLAQAMAQDTPVA